MARLLLKLAILIIVLIIIVFVAGTIYVSYSNSPLIYSDQLSADTSIYVELSPQVVSNPVDEVMLTWQLEGIQAAYLNDGGVIGNDTRTISFDICEPSSSYQLWVELLDGNVVEYSQTPTFRLVDPIFIILCCIVGIIAVVLLTVLFSLKWHHYVAIGLLVTSALLVAMLMTPQCYDDQLFERVQLTLTPVYSVVYGLTALFSLIIAITATISPQSLVSISRKIRSKISFAVMLMIVTIVSMILYLFATAHFSVLKLHFMILAIVIFILGNSILAIYTMQPLSDDEISQLKIGWSKPPKIIIRVIYFVLWIAIYNLNWVTIINNAMLQGIVAFALFWLAGFILYVALFRPESIGVGDTLYGLLMAMLTTMLLSIVGFVLGLNIPFLLLIYSIMSGIALIKLLDHRYSATIILRSPVLPFAEIAVSVAFMSALLLGIATHHQNTNEITAEDGYTYNAIVTGYTFSDKLGFEDFFLGTDYELVQRLRLRLWTASQAMMVHLSDTSILQIEFVLSIQVLFVSVLAVYYLARQLGLTHTMSLIASIAHLSLLSAHITSHSQIGTQFYMRLLHDKQLVQFVLAPIIVALATQYLDNRTTRHLTLLGMGIATISLIHPTATALIALMVGFYALLSVLTKFDRFPALFVIVVLFVLGMIPSLGIRITSNTQFTTAVTDDNAIIIDNYQGKIDFDENYNLLGLSSSLRTGFAYSLLAVGFFFSVLYFREYPVARYILAACGVIIVASNPFTAPLLAKAISVSHTMRTLWLAPVGIALAFLVHLTLHYIDRFKLFVMPIKIYLLIGLSVMLPTYMLSNLLDTDGEFSAYQSYWNYLTQTEPNYIEWAIELETWLNENASSGDVVFGDAHLQQFLPVIAGDVYPIVFRLIVNQTTMPGPEYEQRRDDLQTMLDALTEGNKPDFVRYLELYSVDWVILNIDVLLQDEPQQLLEMTDPLTTSLVHRIGDLFIYSVDHLDE